MKQKKYKKCPRCDHKVPFFEDRCDSCGLIFSRLKRATNTAAKKYIRKGETNKVICDKVLPRDVNKWKLFWLAFFFGWIGVHYAKVGRYKSFIWAVVSVACLYIAVFLPMEWFNDKYLALLMWALILPGSVYFIFNIISIFEIAFNQFKVPIAIDETLVVEDLDSKVVNDILKEVKEDKKQDKQLNKEEQKVKKEKITVVCASCGRVVKVYNNDTICPKCDEPLKDE